MKTALISCLLVALPWHVGVGQGAAEAESAVRHPVPALKVVVGDVVELFLVKQNDAAEYGGLGVCGVYRQEINLLVRQMHKTYRGQVVEISLVGSQVWHRTRSVARFVDVHATELTPTETKLLGTPTEPASFTIHTRTIDEASDLLRKLSAECKNATIRK